MKCRSCKKLLKLCFIDLGNAPPSNSYLTEKELNSTEIYYPLQVYICDNCWLAQVIDYAGRDIFFNEFYPYFSSVSNSFTSHSKKYVDYVIDRFNLKSTNSQIIEIASNDGYLLQFFKKKNFNCLGIEPSKSCAKAARKKNIKVLEKFFDFDLAKKLAKKNLVDLIVANNVLAHVPDINNFVKGISILLKKKGVVTFEFPHLLELIKNNQYDTIYHEHYSYLSLIAVNTIFEKNGLNIFDVQKINTHGGSLRVFAQKKTNNYYQVEKMYQRLFQLKKK